MATSADIQTRLIEFTNKTIDDQATAFLHKFLVDFEGGFDIVLDQAERFKKAIGKQPGPDDPEVPGASLDLINAQSLLRDEGFTLTVVEIKRYLADTMPGSGKNLRFPFIAYLLFLHDKTPVELLALREDDMHPTLKQLHEAVTAFEEMHALFRARNKKKEELKVLAEAGGLEGGRARIVIQQMERDDSDNQGMLETQMKKAKRAAVKYHQENDPIKAEQARLQSQKKADDAAAKERRAESKAKIKAMGAIWSSN